MPFTSHRLILLRVYYFCMLGMLGIYLPFFPPWLRAQHISGMDLSIVMAIPPALGVVGPPLFGLLADALHLRGQMLRIASGIAAMAFVGMGIIPFIFGRGVNFIELIALMAMYSFFRSPLIPMADVIALEESKAKGKSYASIRWWGSLGFLVTASVSGRIVDPSSPAALPTAISIMLVLGFLASFALPTRASAQAPAPVWSEAKNLLKSGDFLLFLLATIIGQSAHTAYDICFSLHLRDLGVSTATTGIAWSLGVVFEIALMAFLGGTVERIRPPLLLVLAFSGAALRWLCIASIEQPHLLIATQPLHALTFGVMWIASLSHVRARVPARILATGQGVFSAGIAVGCVIGVFCFGPLFERAGGPHSFKVAALLSALAAVLAALLFALSKNRPRPHT